MAVTCSHRSARSWRFSVRRGSSPKSPRRSPLPRALFSASGYVQEAMLTDYVLEGPALSERSAARVEGFVIPVTIDDLAANGLLEEAHQQVCWERSVETLTARKDDIAGLAVASDERIEAYLLYIGARSDYVAAHFHRGWWSPSDATALSTSRARDGDLPFSEGPPGRDLDGVPGDARFPPSRRASTLRREGAVRLDGTSSSPSFQLDVDCTVGAETVPDVRVRVAGLAGPERDRPIAKLARIKENSAIWQVFMGCMT